jgi:hypothetical protein
MPTKNIRISAGKTTFRSTYADSNALWRVIAPRGKGTYLCEIVNEPIEYDGRILDGDYAGVQKAFLREEILQSLNWQNLFENIHDESDKFYNNLSVDDVIHYNNGFNQYVRCKVVLEDNEKKLLPVALVGGWREYDLPHRRINGEIEYGYNARQINEQVSMRPNATNIWEFNRKGANPADLLPIDLSVPDMTPDQSDIAKKWQTVQKINDLTSDYSTDNPQDIIDSVKRLLNTN